MITEYEPAIAPTVAMFATYDQLGGELAALHVRRKAAHTAHL